MDERTWSLETRLIHGGSNAGNAAPWPAPLALNTAFPYESAEGLEAVFAGREPGYVYSRIANPTVAGLEATLTALEDGIGAIGVASGMAAVSSLVLALAGNGDDIVAGNSLFGGTYSLLAETLGRYGIKTAFVDTADPAAFRDAIGSRTKLVLVETIGNPKLDVADISAISAVARERGVPLAVDSTVTTPILVQPKRFGADLIIHSASKFINGHGTAIGGAIVDAGTFAWSDQRFPALAPWPARVGRYALLAFLRNRICRDMGCCLAPFNAFLLNVGIESLGVRMERHCANAAAVASMLGKHPKVENARYPGLDTHPQHDLARRQFNGRYGGMVTLRLGARDRAFRFANGLRLARNTANIGDARTLVIHPASTFCRDFNPQERLAMGVTDDLVRLSIGLEHPADILADIEQALKAL